VELKPVDKVKSSVDSAAEAATIMQRFLAQRQGRQSLAQVEAALIDSALEANQKAFSSGSALAAARLSPGIQEDMNEVQ